MTTMCAFSCQQCGEQLYLTLGFSREHCAVVYTATETHLTDSPVIKAVATRCHEGPYLRSFSPLRVTVIT